MDGFLLQAIQGAYRGQPLSALKQVISSFDPATIPIHRTLAEEFTICDRWFSSVPGPTEPNRAFLHSATSHGLHHNDRNALIKGFPQRTIQQDITDSGLTWKSYFVEGPTLAFFQGVRWQALSRTRGMNRFYKDAREGKLANYTFLEPNYGEFKRNKGKASDGHASEPFQNAELFLKSVYEALRNGPLWNNTLLIIK